MRSYRSTMLGAAIAAMALITAQAWGGGDQPAEVAALVTLDQPGDSQSSVGDLIGLKLTFPIVPGAMLSNLRVSIRGEAVRFVTVASNPPASGGRPVIGVGSLSAFVVAERSGDSIVTVTPVKLDGSNGEPKEYRIRVGARKPPGR